MTDRPILFSGQMVRALLDGRKTQTRRLLKPQPGPCNHKPWPGSHNEFVPSIDEDGVHCASCGNGLRNAKTKSGVRGIPLRWRVDDRLWVRETFARVGLREPEKVFYRADGEHQHMGTGKESNGNVTEYWTDCWILNGQTKKGAAWKPAIHMPRWASRLTLTVTDVRVQRLQDISEADAIAEGTQEPTLVPIIGACWSERDAYAKLWSSINGAGTWASSWAANPWVVALTFTVDQKT